MCTLVLGVPTAYVLARRNNAFTRTVEELLVMPVAVPGLATALALIVTFGSFGDLRRSWVFILIGHVLFTLPFMVRSVLAVLARDRHEDAGRGRAQPGRELRCSASSASCCPTAARASWPAR
jgi:putative spermidine/putrescine transport system permease protein